MKGNAGRKSVLLSQMSGIWPNGTFHFLANEETMRLVPQRCDAINAKIHFLEKNGVKKKRGTLKQHTHKKLLLLFRSSLTMSFFPSLQHFLKMR